MARRKTKGHSVYEHGKIDDVALLIATSGLGMADCNNLLYPDNEATTVAIIRRHLATRNQLDELHERGLSIEDCLNGRVTAKDQAFVIEDMFRAWNIRLGRKQFGF